MGHSGWFRIGFWLAVAISLLALNCHIPEIIFAADRCAISAGWWLGSLAGDRRLWLRAHDRDVDCQRSIYERAKHGFRSLLRHLAFVFVWRAPAIEFDLLL